MPVAIASRLRGINTAFPEVRASIADVVFRLLERRLGFGVFREGALTTLRLWPGLALYVQ
jgi:hypothetical protein